MDRGRIIRIPYFLGVILDFINLKFQWLQKRPVFQRGRVVFRVTPQGISIPKRGFLLWGKTLTLYGQGSLSFSKRLDLQFSWDVLRPIPGIDTVLNVFKENFFFYLEVKGSIEKPRLRIRALRLLTPSK